MKALVYLRVSTEEQAEKGYSIQAQRIECVNKAEELGCNMEDIGIFSDEGVSGAVLERPQLMAALDMLKKGGSEVSFFICYDSSRLSRNAAHQLIIVDEIKKHGAKLIFIRNSFPDNAEGRFQLTVMAAVDEYERARLRLRTELGKRTKASQHKLTHNPGLYGYDFDTKTDALNINEEQKENLRLMFSLLTGELKGPAEIAELLNEADIPSPRLKLWNRVTVRRILSNPSYLGILYIRRYDTRDYHLNKYKSEGEKIKVKEKPKCEWIPIEIPQIIDSHTWERAQEILKSSKPSKQKNEKAEFLLTSFLKCGNCGSTMSGKRIVKGGRSYYYYICSRKYKHSSKDKCNAAIIRADKIEKDVWKHIHERICAYIEKGLDVEELAGSLAAYKENNGKNINVKKEKAKKEIERIKTMFQKGYIDEEEMAMRLGGLEELIGKLDLTAAGNERMESALSIWQEIGGLKENLPYILKEMLNRLNNKEKKLIIGYTVAEITVSFPSDTTLVGDVPESYITVPEADIPNYTPTNDPFDQK